MAAARTDSRALPVQRTELARRVLEKPPAGTAGAIVCSNVGYAIAGAAIERLKNLAWEDAMLASVFRPLGMALASFGAPDGKNPCGHRRVPPQFETLTPADVGAMGDNAAVTRPAGGANVSIADYGRFLAIFLGGSPELPTKTSLARLTTPRTGDERPYALVGAYARMTSGRAAHCARKRDRIRSGTPKSRWPERAAWALLPSPMQVQSSP